MVGENPFYYNLPIRPEDFVGRWAVVEEIVPDLCRVRADSWAVIGGRRFGKSSFLKAIEWQLLVRLSRCGPGDFYVVPLIVDLKGCGTDGPGNVYAGTLRLLYRFLHRSQVLKFDLARTQLQEMMGKRRNETLTFYQFEDILDDLVLAFQERCGPFRLALLLDEAEAVTRFPWSETLFNQLRALIYDGPLAKAVKLVLTGSASVVQVRQAGSPLLNAVKIFHLAALATADVLKIIERGGKMADGAVAAVLEQSGGHPFIAQYLLHHLWKDGLTEATTADVESMAQQLRQQRAADLQGWWEAVGDSGQQAYAVLAEAGDWVDERTLLAQLKDAVLPVDQGMAALCYHGLALRDGSGQRYRVNGELFRDWFTRRTNVTEASFSGLRKQLNVLDDPGIDTLCLDHFPEIYDKFGRGMRKDEKINLILSYCRRRTAYYQRLVSMMEEIYERGE